MITAPNYDKRHANAWISEPNKIIWQWVAYRCVCDFTVSSKRAEQMFCQRVYRDFIACHFLILYHTLPVMHHISSEELDIWWISGCTAHHSMQAILTDAGSQERTEKQGPCEACKCYTVSARHPLSWLTMKNKGVMLATIWCSRYCSGAVYTSDSVLSLCARKDFSSVQTWCVNVYRAVMAVWRQSKCFVCCCCHLPSDQVSLPPVCLRRAE